VLKQISELLNRISNGWVALTALSIFLLFSALVLPKQSAQASAELGDIGSPDLSLLYSVDDLYQFAEAYGDQGRAAYIRTRAFAVRGATQFWEPRNPTNPPAAAGFWVRSAANP
jgi:hypothetical protein